MKPSRFLLLDANVVIELFARGLWDKVIKRLEICLAATILGEAQYYENDNGERQYFDLQEYANQGKVTTLSMFPSEVTSFKGLFTRPYLEKLDAGEAESLAYIVKHKEQDIQLCSADKIVYRVLGALDLGDKAISLEEILHAIGYGRKLHHQYSTAYREQWTKKGFTEGFTGMGLRKP